MEFMTPEQVGVSDNTYIGNRKNPSKLLVVNNRFVFKKITGYNVCDCLNVKASLLDLEMVLKNRMYRNQSTAYHSDRVLQYCSNKYQIILDKSDIL